MFQTTNQLQSWWDFRIYCYVYRKVTVTVVNGYINQLIQWDWLAPTWLGNLTRSSPWLVGNILDTSSEPLLPNHSIDDAGNKLEILILARKYMANHHAGKKWFGTVPTWMQRKNGQRKPNQLKVYTQPKTEVHIPTHNQYKYCCIHIYIYTYLYIYIYICVYACVCVLL